MAFFKNPFGGKKDEAPSGGDGGRDGGGDGGGGEGDGGEEGGEHQLEEGMVSDTKQVTPEQFFKIQAEKAAVPEKGETKEERNYWVRARRWQVRIYNVSMANQTDEEMSIFLNFIFGGSREEFKVRDEGGKPVIWVCGEEGKVLRTPVINDTPGDDESTRTNFDESFEWRGSYADLERQVLRIEMWNWAQLRVNKFDSSHEEALIHYAKGHIANEVECVKVLGPGRRKVRAKLSFSLYFQEIYDFSLGFEGWRATGVGSCGYFLQKLRNILDEEEIRDEDLSALVEPSESVKTKPSVAKEAKDDDSDEAESTDSETGPLLDYKRKHHDLKKTIEINFPGNWTYWCKGKRFISKASEGVSPTWGELAKKVQFRGTVSDLYNVKMKIKVFTDEKPEDIGQASGNCCVCWGGSWCLRGGSSIRGSRHNGIPMSVTKVSLKGILEHGDLRNVLKPSSWITSAPGGDRYAHRLNCGLLEGHVSVGNQPRYQQLDNVDDDIDSSRRYLYVKVVSVDRVITPDNRHTQEIDTFVEVTYDAESQRTKVVQDSSQPKFNEEKKFELHLTEVRVGKNADLDLSIDTEQTWAEIAGKGPITFDLWTEGAVSQEHLGYCEFFLSEILVTDKGTPQKTTEKTFLDKKTQTEETKMVRTFKGSKKLKFIWGSAGSGKVNESNLSLEIWFMPDLNAHVQLEDVRAELPLPKLLLDRWDEHAENWEKRTKPLQSSERAFPYIFKNQMHQEFFVPRFCDTIKPPKVVDRANAVMHYIGCFPYVAKKNRSIVKPVAYTPDFFKELRKGEALDHAILHCSFLLGLMAKAFVCVGTTWRHEPHAWVATFEEGSVKFWEPYLSSGVYVLKKRFAHPEFVMGSPPKRLPEADIRAEINRRKRLRIRKERWLRLETKDHPHILEYGDRSDFIHEGMDCMKCRKKAAVDFQRGFYCTVTQDVMCWSCADPLFMDAAELADPENAIDPREPFDFEGTNMEFDVRQILPYRSVEIVFNNTNVWANMQHANPKKIFWDLWNPTYWHSFAPATTGLRPCFRGCHFIPAKDITKKKGQILAKMASGVRKYRLEKNLHTTWARIPVLSAFLELGLKLRMEKDTCEDALVPEYTKQLEDWENCLLAKTLDKHKVRTMLMHFNFADANLIAKEFCERCDFLDSREKSSQFAVVAHVQGFPGDVVSVYVYLCMTYHMNESQVEEEVKMRANGNANLEGDPTVLFQALQQADKEAGKTINDLLLDSVQAYKDGGGVVKTVDEVLVMSGWSTNKVSKHVQITEGGLTATYTSKKDGEYAMCGGVLGNRPIPGSADGKYFEVSITAAKPGPPDGMAIGVTSRVPETVAEIPMTMDDVSPSWLAGFNGTFWNGAQKMKTDISWKPSQLRVGDHVGFLVSSAGTATVFVNGQEVASLAMAIPSDGSLYAVVDLIGCTNGVSLVLGARAPSGSNPWVKVKSMKKFCRDKFGKYVNLSDDGVSAAYVAPAGEEFFGVVIGEGPVPSVPHDLESIYFEVRVDAVRSGYPDGLGIGVTTMTPNDITKMPQTMDLLDPCWAVGYNGQMYDGGTTKWAEITWNSSDLNVGDQVGILVTGTGQMQVYVNGMFQCEGPENIPRTKPLYAVLDLLGNTEAVSLCVGAQAPVTPLLLAPTQAMMRGGGSQSSSVDKPPKMTGFVAGKAGSNVRLAKDCLTAVHTEEQGYDLHGGLLGNGALEKGENGWYFEVRIDSVRPEIDEGLAIGVTTCNPNDVKSIPDTMDEIDPCWLVGYDGNEWDGASLNWYPSPFKPNELQTDDHVGVLVTPSGELAVFVNGKASMQGHGTVAVDQPIYAIVDLVGATGGVTLILDALPPDEAEIAKSAKKREAAIPKLFDDPYANPPERPPDEMRTFCKTVMGKRVKMSADGLTITKTGTQEDLFGGALGDGVIPEVPKGKYFEVRIDSVSQGEPDGLAIGVTTARPDETNKLPDTLDRLKTSWLVGFNGEMWDGREREFTPVNWYPADLRVGDRVGVWIGAGSGMMKIYVNGEKRVDGARGLPISKPLFPAVDLIGNTRGVTLMVGAPAPDDKAAREVRLKGGFSAATHGLHISISDDKMRAVLDKFDDSGMHGTVLTADPLRDVGHGRRYFEILINDVMLGVLESRPDGLAIGVTTRRPEEIRQMPASADGLKPAWLIGFDGAFYDGGGLQWGICEWDTRTLRNGDVVAVSVSNIGSLSVYVNGNWKASGPSRIPAEPLYGVVDLLGSVKSIGLVSNAKPPGHGQESKPQTDASETVGIMRGFNRSVVGNTVHISDDGQSATRARMADEGFNGVVIGDGKLVPNKQGAYSFEFYITATESGEANGLAVGFTSRPPSTLRKLPETADLLDPCWLVGFDGASWDGATMAWGYCDWNAHDLAVGDFVRVVLAKGELQAFVNRKRRASQKMNIPAGAELFALFDLSGSTAGISLSPPALDQRRAPPEQDDIVDGFVGKQYMTGFHPRKLGQNITLVNGNMEARRADGVTDGCVVIGDKPLEPNRYGDVSFTLSITKTQPGFEQGLLVGFTFTSPKELTEAPETADMIEPSWLVGLDGWTWDGETSDQGLSQWNPTTLKVGDLLKVIATKRHELKIVVNGVEEAAHSLHLPTGKDLYAVVDLAGSTAAVTLVLSDGSAPKPHAAIAPTITLTPPSSPDKEKGKSGKLGYRVFRHADGREIRAPLMGPEW